MRLEQLRLARGVSVAEVARQIKESPSTVQTWFVGKAVPRFDVMGKLADYFGVSLDLLAGRDAYTPDLTPAERSIVEIVRTVGVAEARRRLLLAPQEPVVAGPLAGGDPVGGAGAAEKFLRFFGRVY